MSAHEPGSSNRTDLGPPHTENEFEPCVDRFIEEFSATRSNWENMWDFDLNSYTSVRPMLSMSPERQLGLLTYLLHLHAELTRKTSKYLVLDRGQTGRSAPAPWEIRDALDAVIQRLVRRKLAFEEKHIEQMLSSFVEAKDSAPFGLARLVGIIETFSRENALSQTMRRQLQELRPRIAQGEPEEIRHLTRLDRLIDDGDSMPLHPSDAWAATIVSDIESQDDERRRAWQLLMDLFAGATQARPSQVWLENARPLVEQIGQKRYADMLQRWLPLVKPSAEPRLCTGAWGTQAWVYIHPDNVTILKGLVWTSILVESSAIVTVLGDAAIRAYRKIPGVGFFSQAFGNACIAALGGIHSRSSIAQLSRLATAIRNGTVQKLIDGLLTESAAQLDLTRDDLEELSTPTFGMQETGLLRMEMGTHTAVLEITDTATTNLHFVHSETGKKQRSAPASLKKLFSPELQTLKAARKEIPITLSVVRRRIEDWYLRQRSIGVAAWRERYLNHPVVGYLARRLVWIVEDQAGGARQTLLFSDGSARDLEGRSSSIPTDGRVRLWHPLDTSVDEVLRWRARLLDLQITQPFKQAWREVYVLTDAERQAGVYSSRYAAHILRQYQFAALLKDRGWKYELIGRWDQHDSVPHRKLDEWNLQAEFRVDGIYDEEESSERGVLLYVGTGQVRFIREDRELELAAVPSFVFSEVMRDIDLFVGVSSIGNDPNWIEHGGGRHDRYWHHYSFGDLTQTSQTRRLVLESLLPRLKIADRCRLTDRFLIVDGELRTYKIHLGSGNVLMEPDDRYLCIVPAGPAREKYFLPFEGDQTLSLILSKAFLLASDTKIQDSTIMRQIRPPG